MAAQRQHDEERRGPRSMLPDDWDNGDLKEAMHALQEFTRCTPSGVPVNKGYLLLMRHIEMNLASMIRVNTKADLVSDPTHVERTLRNQGARGVFLRMAAPGFGIIESIEARIRERAAAAQAMNRSAGR